jgi:competence protein ComEC
MQNLLIQQSWTKQRVHASWHIAALSIGVLLGVVIAGFSNLRIVGYEWVGLAGALFTVGIISRRRNIIVVMVIAGGVLGLLRGSGEQTALEHYQQYYESHVILGGTVAEDPTYGTKGDLRLKLKGVQINSSSLPGTVWVSSAQNHDIKRGDKLVVGGTLEEGFGTIAASMFRADIVSAERPIPGDIGRRLRDWFATGVKNSMPVQEAQLALAFLVGQKLTDSETLNEELRTVGLIHAVVASGYHLTVLIEFVRRLLTKVSKYLTLVCSAGLVSVFILITGFSPSMTRAGLVAGLGLIAWYYGRVMHPLVLLPVAAAVTVLYQPEYLWGDVGWYLSFAAFAGVLVLAPLLNHYFWNSSKRPGMFREILLATVSAQLVTLPIIVSVFGYYSAYALLANLLVVPLIPLVMMLTFISGVVGLIVPAMATILSVPLVWMLNYMIAIVEWISGFPSAKTEIQLGPFGILVSYAAIICFTVFLWIKTKHDFRNSIDNQKLF